MMLNLYIFVKDKCYFKNIDRAYMVINIYLKLLIESSSNKIKKYVEQLTSYRFRKGGSSGIYGSGGYWVEFI